MADLPVEGRLASFDGRDAGGSTRAPLTPAGLRGKVVLVDFWTYTCINWLRTLGYVRAWAERVRATRASSWSASTRRSSRSSGTPTTSAGRSTDDGRRVSGRARQRLRGLGGVRQPLLAGRLHRRRRGPDPAPPLRRGRLRRVRARHPAAARRVDGSATPGLGRSRGLRGCRPTGRTCDRPRPTSARARPRQTRGAAPGRARCAQPVGADGRLDVEPRCGRARPRRAAGIAFRFHARDVHLVMGPRERGASVPFRVLLDGEPPGAAHGLDVDARRHGDGDRAAPLPAVRQPARSTTARSRSTSSRRGRGLLLHVRLG